MTNLELLSTATFAPLIRSDRLTMTLLSYEDATHIEYIKHIGWEMAKSFGEEEPKSVDSLKKRWAKAHLQPNLCKDLLAPGPAIYFVREGKDDSIGPIIGSVTLHHRDAHVPPDIGFGLRREYQGKGYASEAVKEVMKYWRDDFGIFNFMICTSEQNIPAIRLAERIGFVRQAHTTPSKDGYYLTIYLAPGTEPLPEGMVLNISK